MYLLCVYVNMITNLEFGKVLGAFAFVQKGGLRSFISLSTFEDR